MARINQKVRYRGLASLLRFTQMDGDGRHRPEDLARLCFALTSSDADVARGSRFLPGSGPLQMPNSRRLGAAYLRLLIRCLFKRETSDPLSGLMAVRPSVLKQFAAAGGRPNLFAALCHPQLHQIELPVSMPPRASGTGSFSALSGCAFLARMTRDLAQVAWGRPLRERGPD